MTMLNQVMAYITAGLTPQILEFADPLAASAVDHGIAIYIVSQTHKLQHGRYRSCMQAALAFNTLLT